jgi:hypothetical protein
VSLCYRNWLARSRRFGTSKMDSLLFIEMLSNIGVNLSAARVDAFWDRGELVEHHVSLRCLDRLP